MLKHLGNNSLHWIAKALTDAIHKGKYPSNWKTAKVIAILKPGKKANDPSSYRPISLLCCTFKLLETLTHHTKANLTPNRTMHSSSEQAGFRKQHSTDQQLLALTTYIESGYEQKLKTGAIVIDLSAAYDTVWRDGLLLKVAKIIKCKNNSPIDIKNDWPALFLHYCGKWLQ